MSHYLSNNWTVSGTDPEVFKELIKKIDAHTHYVYVDFKDVIVNSLTVDDEGVSAYEIDPSSVLANGIVLKKPISLNFIENTVGHGVMTEACQDGIIFTYRSHNHCHLVSSNAYATLGQRIALPGTAMLFRSLARDCLIAEHIGHHAGLKKAVAVVKESEGVAKIFAFLTTNYIPVPLDIINEITDKLIHESKLGKAECIQWNANHDMVSIDYKFTEYADELSDVYGLTEKMIPCVRLMTSDVGECSIRATGFWMTENGDKVICDEYAKAHKGSMEKGGISVSEIKKNVEERIFDKYVVFPQRMKALAYVKVTPEDFDLKTEKGRNKNKKLLVSVYMRVLRELGLLTILGSKRVKPLRIALEMSLIDENVAYSAYAIAKDIISLPRIMKSWWASSELPEAALEKFQKAVSRVVYLDFESMKHSKREEAMYFTPDVEEE